MLGGDDDRGRLHRLAVLIGDGDLALGVGAEGRRLAGFPRLVHEPQDAVGVVDRRRHQFRRLAAGVAEHDALVAGALVLVAGGIDALGDVGRLGVEQNLDLGGLPVEAVLLVADVADGLAGKVLDLVEDRVGAAHFAGDDDAIGGGERLAGDARLRQRREVGVDDGVGDPVADLVRMTFGDRLAGEQIGGSRHRSAFLKREAWTDDRHPRPCRGSVLAANPWGVNRQICPEWRRSGEGYPTMRPPRNAQTKTTPDFAANRLSRRRPRPRRRGRDR